MPRERIKLTEQIILYSSYWIVYLNQDLMIHIVHEEFSSSLVQTIPMSSNGKVICIILVGTMHLVVNFFVILNQGSAIFVILLYSFSAGQTYFIDKQLNAFKTANRKTQSMSLYCVIEAAIFCSHDLQQGIFQRVVQTQILYLSLS